MIELSFQDVEVGELLDLIARQFDVQVVISGDVSGRLRSINLTNKTPEAAIRHVVAAANLKWRKLEDGTFLIGKQLPEGDSVLTDIKVLNSQTQKSPPHSFDNSDLSRNTLPSLGSEDPFSSLPANTDIPSLVGTTNLSGQKRQHMVRIRNVPPAVMAYWLDPANNPVPLQLQFPGNTQEQYGKQPIAEDALGAGDQAAQGGNVSPLTQFNNANSSFNPYTQRSSAELRSNAQFGGGGGGGAGGAGGASIQRPEGVDRIVAIDAQNALLVFGTDEGVRSLQEIINFLDRPVRQVEIEAQFVTVRAGDSSAFGIQFNASRNGFVVNSDPGLPQTNFVTGGQQVGFVGANFQAVLTTLVSQNRAKVITAPRVTTLNNLTASLLARTDTPVVLSSSRENPVTGVITTTVRLLFIRTAIGLIVTPTINADDTVTVVLQPQVAIPTPSGVPGFANIPIVNTQSLATIANVRDGDTLALGGLRNAVQSRGGTRIPILSDLPLIGGLFRSRTNVTDDAELIIFLTARIVRRAGDEEPVPGT